MFDAICKVMFPLGFGLTLGLTVSSAQDGTLDDGWTFGLFAVCNLYMLFASARMWGLLGERAKRVDEAFHAAFPFIVILLAVMVTLTH